MPINYLDESRSKTGKIADFKKDPRRRCLKFNEWPEQDRKTWDTVLRKCDILDDDYGAASHWAPATIRKHRSSYGRWLNFCSQTGLLSGHNDPAERVTQAAIRLYLDELRAIGNSPDTVRARIVELYGVIRAFAPERDWSWLRPLCKRLEATAYPVRDKWARNLSAADISSWALQEMARINSECGQNSKRDALRYGDALMIAFLIHCPFLRLRNLGATRIGHHLQRHECGYSLMFEADERKAKRPDGDEIPPELTGPLERYLGYYRIRLIKDSDSDRLWISYVGTPMADITIYGRLKKATKQAFGLALSPHDFRYIAATTIALHDPEHVRTAAAVLGHQYFRTTEKHYIQAHALQASRKLSGTIRDLRQKEHRKRKSHR